MKKLLFGFLYFLLSFLNGQIQNPIEWNYEVNHLKDNQFEIIFKGKLEPNWHVYSKDIKIDNAIPTSIHISPNSDIKLIGELLEIGNKKEEYSELFGGTMIYLSGNIQYKQKLEISKAAHKVKIEAEIEFQVCDDKICLTPDYKDFTIEIVNPQNNIQKIDSAELIQRSENIISNKIDNEDNISITDKIEKSDLIFNSLDTKNPINKECGEEIVKKENNIWIFIFGFLGGLIALLTPCVYPMIPLTISYFTKNVNQSNGKKDAMIYAFFIFFIFVFFYCSISSYKRN